MKYLFLSINKYEFIFRVLENLKYISLVLIMFFNHYKFFNLAIIFHR
jgi:hypothetical protein